MLSERIILEKYKNCIRKYFDSIVKREEYDAQAEVLAEVLELRPTEEIEIILKIIAEMKGERQCR